MGKKFRFVIIFAVLMVVMLGQTVSAQTGDSEYFPETGHNLEGDFFSFYFDHPDPQRVFGMPITEAYIDPSTGRLVQYFENVRFEYFSDNPVGAKVALSPLGAELYEHGTAIPNLTNSTPNCLQEADWSYPVCYSFLGFYRQNGGQSMFGKPVSGLEYLRGRLVQFFEYAELVWMPENPQQARIVIAPLGLTYFHAIGEDTSRLAPIRNFQYNLNISDIQVNAFTKYAVISSGSNQAVNVIAKDQNNAPLTNGIVQITVLYPDSTETNTSSLATDEFGLANLAFIAQSERTGPVEVVVKVLYNDLESYAITSFRIGY